MQLGPLVEGAFEQRLNRFAALVGVDGRQAMVHVANSGRMRELLWQGNRCLLAPRTAAGRKTAYDLALVEVARDRAVGEPRAEYDGADPGRVLVSADARLPPALLSEAFHEGRLPPFAEYDTARREVVYGDSRLDLLLSGPHGACFIEVKSVTLVEDGVALFPDAPTERGRRHLGALVREDAVDEGYRAAAVFVIQREDARGTTAPPTTPQTPPSAAPSATPSPPASRPTRTSAASRGGIYGWPTRSRCCSEWTDRNMIN